MKKIVVAFVAQKGGVGKSTLARAFATMASKEGYVVRLIDLDVQQMTTLHWHEQRVKNGYKPIGTVEAVAKVSQAIEQAGDFDFLIFDGSARASQGTLEIAKIADLVVIPTCACAFRFVRTAIPASSGHVYRCHPDKLKLHSPSSLFTSFPQS